MRLRDGAARAFVIHLGISAAIVGTFALAAWRLWYPQPFFMHDGGWQVLRVIVPVDVVLGPLLTLIVFDRAKPELRRDLTVIVSLQLAAFAYGAWVMYHWRPAFLVHAAASFHSVPWPDMLRATPDPAPARAIAAGAAAPVVVLLDLPADAAKRGALMRASLAGGPAIIHLGQHYRVLDEAAFARIASEGADIEALARNDAEVKTALDALRARHPGGIAGYLFVPAQLRYGMLMLVFDRRTRSLIDWME